MNSTINHKYIHKNYSESVLYGKYFQSNSVIRIDPGIDTNALEAISQLAIMPIIHIILACYDVYSFSNIAIAGNLSLYWHFIGISHFYKIN